MTGKKSASASNDPTRTHSEKAAFAGLGFGVTKMRAPPILHSCAPRSTSPVTRHPAYRANARHPVAPWNQTTPGSIRSTSASRRAAPLRNSGGRSSPLPVVGRFTMSVFEEQGSGLVRVAPFLVALRVAGQDGAQGGADGVRGVRAGGVGDFGQRGVEPCPRGPRQHVVQLRQVVGLRGRPVRLQPVQRLQGELGRTGLEDRDPGECGVEVAARVEEVRGVAQRLCPVEHLADFEKSVLLPRVGVSCGLGGRGRPCVFLHYRVPASYSGENGLPPDLSVKWHPRCCQG